MMETQTILIVVPMRVPLVRAEMDLCRQVKSATMAMRLKMIHAPVRASMPHVETDLRSREKNVMMEIVTTLMHASTHVFLLHVVMVLFLRHAHCTMNTPSTREAFHHGDCGMTEELMPN